MMKLNVLILVALILYYPSPAYAEFCGFNITSVPSGAKVFLEDGYIGDTPLLHAIGFPGSYKLRVEKEGYAPWEMYVDIPQDTTVPLNVALRSTAASYVLPAVATAVSAIFAAKVLLLYLSRRKPYFLAWGVALAMFSIATGSEALALAMRWTEFLVKTYYLFGATLAVGYLGLGTLYLLASRRAADIFLVLLLSASITAAWAVFQTPVDASQLQTLGWQAIQRTALMKVIAISLNSIGTVILVGGAVYSAWFSLRNKSMLNRAIGNALIASGTIIAASGGALARLGIPGYLSLALTAGIALMFAGFLLAAKDSKK